MHGPWHPILHNSPRPYKGRETQTAGPEYVLVIANDYRWYRPLDSSRKEIRILYLEPEPLHSPKDVVVHVFNASLLEPNIPRLYGCLSYYWGDPKITKAIQVMYTEKSESENNGLLTTQTEFRVNANLEAALRVFRSKLNRPVMWADALCINQSDIDERSPQVGLMAEIYAQAVQTIVRLGDADGTTKTVFDFADLITTMEAKAHEVDPAMTIAGINCRRLRPLAKGEVPFTEEEIYSDDFYKVRWGIQALLARPFFRRAWVLQEVGLADREQVVVHCGEHSLWWQTFQNLISFEWRAAAHQGPLPINLERDKRLELPSGNPSMRPGSHYVLPEIWSYLRRYCSNTKRGKILELIFRRLEIQATDPRDQVFALFSLADECQIQSDLHPGFQASYSRNVTEAFMLFTRAVIGKLNNLIVLSAVDVFEQSDTRKERGLPSWVPEYDKHINLRRTLGFLGEGYYNASGRSKPNISLSDSKTLSLSGEIVDQVGIEREWGPYHLRVETENVNNIAKPAILHVEDAPDGIHLLWQMVSRRIKASRIAHQELLETFILTLICSRRTYFDRAIITSVTDVPELLADFAAYWKLRDGKMSLLLPKTIFYNSQRELFELAEWGHAGRFGQRLFYTCHERSFFVSETGLLGVAPRSTKTGDLIAVCDGANVPFVVRKVSTEEHLPETRMEFVGECYIHGMMAGNTPHDFGRERVMGEVLHLI